MSVDELITENINLVYWVLSKYYPAFLKDDDLVQIGMLGFMPHGDLTNHGGIRSLRLLRNVYGMKYEKSS